MGYAKIPTGRQILLFNLQPGCIAYLHDAMGAERVDAADKSRSLEFYFDNVRVRPRITRTELDKKLDIIQKHIKKMTPAECALVSETALSFLMEARDNVDTGDVEAQKIAMHVLTLMASGGSMKFKFGVRSI